MKYRLVELLQAPGDGGQLRIGSVKETREASFTDRLNEVKCKRFCALKNCPVAEARVTPQDCAKCYSQEILEGELVSDSGERYPITGGIPRLLSGSAAEFVKKNKKSFSLEWKYFRFGERNWGMDIESRKKLFLQAFGKEPKELKGKLILDAGCGSGLLSIEIAKSFGMEVVALDLATGIEKAYQMNTNPYLYFIQGSVLEPPLQSRVVDYIYCAGVLVAIPDTWAGFAALSRCIKVNGRCLIWLYHPIENHRRTGDYTREQLYEWIRRRVTSRLPIQAQELLCLCLLPPYFIKRTILNPFKKVKEKRTWREKMQNFIDTLSPMYANRHTPDETAKKFREFGFENMAVVDNGLYGFAVRGDLARLQNSSSRVSEFSASAG